MSATSDQDLERWRSLVERGLKGAPFDSLVAETLEGLRIQPLYTERDLPGDEGIPWAPRSPRLVGPAGVAGDLPRLQREGASLVWLVVGADESPSQELLGELDGVVTVLAPLRADTAAALGSASVRPIADPWTPWLRDGAVPDAAAALEAIAAAASAGRPALGVATWLWREVHGADLVDELALTLASLVESLRALEGRGAPLEEAIAGATIGVAVGPELFLEIAKLRALRRVVHRALGACGIAARPFVACVTSVRATSQVDPAVNVLRNTLAASAGLIGGADAVAAHRHDGSTDASGPSARLARNTPLVLALESYLGAVDDPARGAYAIEHLTADLAERAWDAFREIEGAGGLARAQATVRERLARSAERREVAVRTRRRPLVGLSRFPAAGAPDPEPTDAQPFEALRKRAAGKVARVITVGACPSARVDFARELLAVAGLSGDVARFEGDLGAALGGASIVILAAADADFEAALPEAARALSAAGAKAVGIAGKPGAHEQALRDAGAHAFVYVGADVVSFIEALLDRAEGAAS